MATSSALRKSEVKGKAVVGAALCVVQYSSSKRMMLKAYLSRNLQKQSISWLVCFALEGAHLRIESKH